MKRRLLLGLGTLALLGVFGLSAGIGFIYSGIYNVAALQQHTAPVYWAIHTAMRHSVGRRADTVAPMPQKAPLFAPGLRLFHAHCVQCHGGPGIAPEPFALGMTPLPVNLVQTAREWSPAEIYWVVRNGIKMTGMPAWEFRFDDSELWAVVAFMTCLPALAPADYRTLAAAADSSLPAVKGMPLAAYCAQHDADQ